MIDDGLRKTIKALRLARDPRHLRALRRGVAATIEHTAVPFRHDYRTVIDVGAGRGQFALFALSRFPNAAIWSFEALPDSFEIAKGVLSGEPRVQLMHAAVGDQEGVAAMYVTRDRDSSSLKAPGVEQERRFPGAGEERVIKVPIHRLSVAFEAGHLVGPVLLKIDVQGAELDVLRGARDLLPGVTSVFVECSFLELYEGQALFDDVSGYLLEHGFRTAGLFSPVYGSDGACVQADVLFERESGGQRPNPQYAEKGGD